MISYKALNTRTQIFGHAFWNFGYRVAYLCVCAVAVASAHWVQALVDVLALPGGILPTLDAQLAQNTTHKVRALNTLCASRTMC